MDVAIFSTKNYEKEFLEKANLKYNHDLHFWDLHLNESTAALASGFTSVCVFVNDQLGRETLEKLAAGQTCLIALRCAGYNNVDLEAAAELGLTVLRVPEYSPHAVAEHAITLMLSLNRKIYRAYNRVREGNFSLDGLVGFDLHGKTVGIVGTGKIGALVSKMLINGFGCKVVAYDLYPNQDLEAQGVEYVDLVSLAAKSDIISLHCPLNQHTRYLINQELINYMKPGVMLINTSRGEIIDTRAVIKGLKSKKIGYLGLDVYEQEADFFFEDLSNEIIDDDILERLLTFPNVLVTSHQAFLTKNALSNIAETTLSNLKGFEDGNIPQTSLVKFDNQQKIMIPSTSPSLK
ncbi:MAG: 2-hydroxyacid dehydrogenase [Cyanobacteria bacterium P01_F01_bin.143]